MSIAEVVFWLSLAAVGYTYVGYPILLRVGSALFGRPVRKGAYEGTFTVIVAAHNEEAVIERRLEELCRQVAATGLVGDILVAANGCDDRTVELARRFEGSRPVQVLEQPGNLGKAAAISEAAALAGGDVLLFADARQTWADDAIPQLLGNFADPDVGAVSGDLKLETSPGVLAGVGLYWRFEKWLRKQESRVWAQVGVTGAICGVRRSLFEPIPPGTILDDVSWPLRVAMTGDRVIHDDSASAFDRLPDQSSAEFRRKVRTLAGVFQLAASVPGALLPWRNPAWLFWASRKLMRLVCPWALLGLAVAPLAIGTEGFRIFALLEAIGYSIALLGMTPVLARTRIGGAAASFAVLNAAAFVAFWVWISGRAGSTWRKTDYQAPAVAGERVA